MLDILEKATQSLGLRYMRMDGNTAVRVRARMVDVFNSDESMAVFLLTTRVGGLGVNLTGEGWRDAEIVYVLLLL